VRVPVVQIRPVRVRVHERLVAMPVGVARVRRETRVRVPVMAVVVPMRMDVLERVVDVRVLVSAREQQPHGERQQRRTGRVQRRQRLAEPEPGESRAEEGRAGEASLRAGGPEALRGGDVERDAHAVAERADGQCRDPRYCASRLGLEPQPDCEVDGPCCAPFPEGAARRRHSVDQRAPVVVERPAATRGCD